MASAAPLAGLSSPDDPASHFCFSANSSKPSQDLCICGSLCWEGASPTELCSQTGPPTPPSPTFWELRYDFHIIQFTILKCKFSVFGVFISVCNHVLPPSSMLSSPLVNSTPQSTPSPRPPLACFCRDELLSLPFPANGIVGHVAFCIIHQVISRSIMFLRLVLVACVRQASLLFTSE